MSATERIPVIDGHNDTLTKVKGDEGRSLLERSDEGHLDLPRARDGGLAGGFFAVFTSSPGWKKEKRPVLDEEGNARPDAFSVPLPPKLDRRTALRFTLSVTSDLFRLEQEADGALEVVSTVDRLRSCIEEEIFAAILHVEGAEVIDTRLEALDVLHAAGLRSLGPCGAAPTPSDTAYPSTFPGIRTRAPV